MCVYMTACVYVLCVAFPRMVHHRFHLSLWWKLLLLLALRGAADGNGSFFSAGLFRKVCSRGFAYSAAKQL